MKYCSEKNIIFVLRRASFFKDSPCFIIMLFQVLRNVIRFVIFKVYTLVQ